MTTNRIAALVTLAAVLVLLDSGQAYADPPGPTDYRSVVVGIDPPSAVLRARFIGGDSFVQLTVERGHELVVSGYQGEPYLWFRSDGVVLENRRSPSRLLNTNRYGKVEVPAGIAPDAAPQWDPAGSGGQFAWHDHRTHWMNSAHPPGAAPGDQILEAVVPLRIDGQPASLTVASYWMAPPGLSSQIAVAMAGLLGVIGQVAAGRLRRGARPVGFVAALALVLGLVAYCSVPRETGPSTWQWALPACGLLALGGSRVVARQGRPMAGQLRDAATLLVGLDVLLWGWLQRSALERAVVPTITPAVLQRSAVAASITVGAITALHGAWSLLRPVRPSARCPAPRPRPASVHDGRSAR